MLKDQSKRPFVFLIAVLLTVVNGCASVTGSDKAKLENLVEKSRITVNDFLADEMMGWMHNQIQDAKGVFIVPLMVKGAFIWGGEYGTGVFLVKDEVTGAWSEPAFYTMGTGSFGLQAGAQASEIVLLAMTRKGVDSMLSSTLKLGVDTSIAAGPVGAGIEGGTAVLSADMVTYARAKGLYGGLSLEGAILEPRDGYNWSYFGKEVMPVDILVKRAVSNPHSAGLRNTLARAASGKGAASGAESTNSN